MLLVLVLRAALVSVGCFPCCSISCSAVVWLLDVVLLVVLVLLLAGELVPALQVVVAMLLLLVVLQRTVFFALSPSAAQ